MSMPEAATGAAAAAGAGSGTGTGTGAGTEGAGAAAAAGAAGGGDGKGGDGKAGQAATGAAADGAGGGADATAAAAAAAAGTGGAAAGDKGAGAAANPWSADTWIGTFAGTDEKKKAWAARRGGIEAALNSAYSADAKIEELTAKAKAGPLAADATPEQIATYRKDNGIPEKAEGYFENLPGGIKLDDADKAMLGDYAKTFHELNLTPAQASRLLATRQEQLDKMVTTQVAQDETVKTAVEDQLRAEWGNDYRPNLNAIHNLLSGFPEDAREALMSARGPDGKAIFNNKSLLQAFAQIARTSSPFGTIVGNDGGSLDAKGVDTRMAEIVKMMGAPKGSADYRAYYDSPKVQEEYRNLIAAQERMKARTAA